MLKTVLFTTLTFQNCATKFACMYSEVRSKAFPYCEDAMFPKFAPFWDQPVELNKLANIFAACNSVSVLFIIRKYKMNFCKPVAIILIASAVASPSFSSTFTYSCSGSISAVKLNTSSEALTVTMGSQSVQAYGNYKQSGSKMIWSGQAGYFEFDVNKQRGYVEWGSKSANCRR